ncbi:MAG TPA: hypothetical protein VME46_08985 [Acidimicrobiales bacterium]|nr:hypothetical protein [Acidimicrobiales bacterium]
MLLSGDGPSGATLPPWRGAGRLDALLAETADRFDATDAVIFVFGPSAALQVLITRQAIGHLRLKWFRRAARAAAQRRETLVWTSPEQDHEPTGSHPAACLALPLGVHDLIAGVLVVGLAARNNLTSAALLSLGYLQDALAYAVDRERALVALEHGSRDAAQLRAQLEMFATDFQSVYQAEQASARGLANTQAELDRARRGGKEKR